MSLYWFVSIYMLLDGGSGFQAEGLGIRGIRGAVVFKSGAYPADRSSGMTEALILLGLSREYGNKHIM